MYPVHSALYLGYKWSSITLRVCGWWL